MNQLSITSTGQMFHLGLFWPPIETATGRLSLTEPPTQAVHVHLTQFDSNNFHVPCSFKPQNMISFNLGLSLGLKTSNLGNNHFPSKFSKLSRGTKFKAPAACKASTKAKASIVHMALVANPLVGIFGSPNPLEKTNPTTPIPTNLMRKRHHAAETLCGNIP